MTTQTHHIGHRARRTMAAATLLLAGGAAAWLYGHERASQAPVAVPAATPAMPAAPTDVASAAAVAAPPPATRPAASGVAMPGKPPMVAQSGEESPAESLRKVQLGLNGGTAEDALVAARTLQLCAMMSKAPEALFAVRDQPDLMPANVKKALREMGAEDRVSNETIARAQNDQRRCQVFDAATLARSGELLQKAYDGKAAGAAMAYLQSLQYPDAKAKADPALIAKLQADVRRAADAGDPDTLMSFAMTVGETARDLGITMTQRNAYQNAWLQIQEERYPGSSKAMKKTMDALSLMMPSTPLTAAQQAEADALAKQVVDAWRHGRQS
jgi:hypothetical protein